MYPTKDEAHSAEAAGLLISQYKSAPNVGALVKILASEVQTLEDSIWTVLDNMTLDAQPLPFDPLRGWDILDKIGAIVGQPRNGESDVNYLAAIKLKIRVNRSDGLAEDLIQITHLLFATPTYREYYPASWEIDTEGLAANLVPILIQALFEAKAAGTRGNLRFSISGPIWVWDSTTGHLAAATGLEDSVGHSFPNAPVSLQSVSG